MIHTTQYDSPLGKLLLAAKDGALVGLWIMGQKYFLESIHEPMEDQPNNPTLIAAENWLDRYFRGENPAIDQLKLAPEGSPFRQTVWKVLQEIPYGKVTTYGQISTEVARRLGKTRMSAQAVGSAVGHNPISIIIPCHRVVGSDGSLTGYAGGIEKKRALLQLEGVCFDGL